MKDVKAKKTFVEPTQEVETVERVYRGEKEVDHDLFKLQTAETQKNVSYSLKKPIWVPVEHSHFFHSYDSNGRPMKHSSAVAGHFHPVEFKVIDGKLQAVCGEPLYRDESKNKTLPYKNDKHTHKCEYVRSERIKVRTLDARAAQIISEYIGNAPAPLQGVSDASR